MGYCIAFSPCLVCGRVFGCNPRAVPSFTRDPAVGREPICQSCMTAINAERERRGLPPHPIRPDAYDPIPEEEL